MIKKVLGTIATRLVIAILTLAMVLINARILGPEKVGTLSLVILAITIIQLLNSFVGGGALVYLVPRLEMVKLIIPAYLWALVTAIAGTSILDIFQLFPKEMGIQFHVIPEGYFLHVLLLSMILSLASVNFMILMGQERIKTYNTITVLQVLCLFAMMMILFFVFRQRSIAAYIKSLYVSYILAFLAGFWMIVPSFKKSSPGGMKAAVKEIFHYGSIMQLGNILQFLNYRVSYYFIEFFLSRAAVGIYSVGVQLSESIWLMAKSIHLVQYTRISNTKDQQYAARLTLNLLKISFLLTLVALVFIMLFLNLFFSLIFKPAFNEVPSIMMAMSAGILIFSVSIILSPYFSGTGKPVHNTISAAVGLVFTLVFSLFLIPRLGLMGAAWAATLAYSAATAYQVVVFIKQAKVTLPDFLLRKRDILSIISEMKTFLKQ